MLYGAHCSGGIKGALDRAIEIGADAVQLFAQSPRMWRFPAHAEEDLARFRERRAEAGIGAVLVHALYLCNLATPDEVVFGKSLETMRATVDAACAIEADGVVFHVGSHLGTGFEAGLERCVPALREVLEHCSETTWLLVENSAGAGGTVGRSIEELAAIVDALDRHERLGICLDSCHLYVSGVDVGEPKLVASTLKEVDERIGLDRLRALHVNDAAAPLGSNRDRHANVLEGELGERLGAFLAHKAVQRLPALMETPGPDDTARTLPRCRSCATCTPGGRSGSALRGLVSIRHKPLVRSRELECVERDRQVGDAWRGDRAEDAERCLARRCPSTPAQLLGADQLADRVVARTGDSQFLCGLADLPPGFCGGRPVSVQTDDERVDARILTGNREAHASSVPAAEGDVRNDSVTRHEKKTCV